MELHSSILMDTTISLVGKHVPNQELVMSPVLLAAWFGFLITFLNLLPAWQLDGGHIAQSNFWCQVAQNSNICKYRHSKLLWILHNGIVCFDV